MDAVNRYLCRHFGTRRPGSEKLVVTGKSFLLNLAWYGILVTAIAFEIRNVIFVIRTPEYAGLEADLTFEGVRWILGAIPIAISVACLFLYGLYVIATAYDKMVNKLDKWVIFECQKEILNTDNSNTEEADH